VNSILTVFMTRTSLQMIHNVGTNVALGGLEYHKNFAFWGATNNHCCCLDFTTLDIRQRQWFQYL